MNASASPSDTVDVRAIVRRGRGMRRMRFLAVGTAVALLAGGGAFAMTNWDRGPLYNTPVVVGPTDEEPHGYTEYSSVDPTFSIRYPDHWNRAEMPLTDLMDPEEILVLGTSELGPGGSCAPNKAVKAMSARDALIFFMEYPSDRGDGDWFRSRGPALRSIPQPVMPECWIEPNSMIAFRDHQRYFQVHIVLGSEASSTTRDEVLSILRSFSTTTTPRQGQSESEPNAPRVVNVTCGDYEATVDTDVVQPTARGIKLRFAPVEDKVEFWLRRADDEGNNQQGPLTRQPHDVFHAGGPGEYLVTCHPKGEYPDYYATEDQGYASFEVIDPQGLWVDPVVDCSSEEEPISYPEDGGVFKVENTGPQRTPRRVVPGEPEAMIRANVPGILDTDELIRPGYPNVDFHAEPRIVIRDGERIASVDIWYSVDEWELKVNRCPGIDIGR